MGPRRPRLVGGGSGDGGEGERGVGPGVHVRKEGGVVGEGTGENQVRLTCCVLGRKFTSATAHTARVCALHASLPQSRTKVVSVASSKQPPPGRTQRCRVLSSTALFPVP